MPMMGEGGWERIKTGKEFATKLGWRHVVVPCNTGQRVRKGWLLGATKTPNSRSEETKINKVEGH